MAIGDRVISLVMEVALCNRRYEVSGWERADKWTWAADQLAL